MGIAQWSTTPANNASGAAPIDWAEGQPPSTVNDSARQMMADVATWYQGPEWLNYGLVPTFVSATQFTTPNNQTATYSVGRRVRAFVSAGTIFGTITASAFTSLTTVTVVWDGTSALDSGVSEVDVGILNPANPSMPLINVSGGLNQMTNTVNGASILKLTGNGSTTPTKFLGVLNGALSIFSSNGAAGLMSLDDSGNLTATGNVASSSDKRLKTDIETITDALARVKALRGVTYRRKDIEQGIRHTGLLAQDVRKVAPEAVKEGPDGYLSVAYGNLVGLLVEAIKELGARVDELEAK